MPMSEVGLVSSCRLLPGICWPAKGAPALLAGQLRVCLQLVRGLPALLTVLTPDVPIQAPHLKHLWLEGNTLTPEATLALLEAAPASPSLSSLGLDRSQLQGVPAAALEAAGSRLRPCEVHGAGPGYFKLDLASAAGAASAAAGGSDGAGGDGAGGCAPGRARVLVVSFGSAPGTPNWGGVLGKIRAAATSAEEADFDVLYVVDPHRAWYGGESAAALRACFSPGKGLVWKTSRPTLCSCSCVVAGSLSVLRASVLSSLFCRGKCGKVWLSSCAASMHSQVEVEPTWLARASMACLQVATRATRPMPSGWKG
jgi:hypothetical protein